MPQGSVIGPVLANLFLHYTFDKWMRIHYPNIPFERYADDTICHCVSKAQAEHLKEVLTRRFEQCRLKLNAEKTKIVQCPTSTRKKVEGSEASFDFSAILSDVASHGIESKASASQTFFLPSAGNR